METEEAEAAALPSSIILHVDLDCFYAAVEQVRLGIPREQPLAVQQWEGLIAVNYAARAAGVVRHDRVSEALRKCPDLRLVHVETIGSDEGTAASRCSAKVSLERYRQASRSVFEIFHRHADVCERASIDEAYLDITRQVELLVEEQCDWDNELERLVGFQRTNGNVPRLEEKSDMIVESGPLKTFNAIDRRLLAGAIIADRIRMDVRMKLGYTCSVGIATNKLLAKIASARHKPDQQTLIPPRAVFDLMNTLPLRKIKLLGGKVGEELSEKWGCCTAGEAQKVPLKSLLSSFGNRLGHYVYRAVRGIQGDRVQEKQILKSMLAAKSFEATNDVAVIRKWLGVLAEELSIRMLRDARDNYRQPHNLQLYYRSGLPRHTGDHSKSCSMPHTVLHLLSSVRSSTSRVAYEQSTSESTKAFQELESEDVLKNVVQSTEQYGPQESELMNKFLVENSKVGSEGTMSEGDIDDTTAGRIAKDLAKLLHQSSFQLFQRIGDAFPCTRLALAASNFQDAPAQGSQSIQHFFVHASQGMNKSPLKPPIAVQGIVGTDWPLHKPRGLLRYMSMSVDPKDPQACGCSSSSDRKQSLSVQNDLESLQVENPNNQVEEPDDCKVDQKKNLLKVASTLSSREKSASEFEMLELYCEESLCQPEQASANLKVDDYSQTNPCFLSRIDTTTITPGSGHHQNAGEVGIRLADMEKHVDLTNINVEEQWRILNEIYGAQSADKGRTDFINNGCALPHERQVAKHRKLTSSKPSQMSLSRYFHSC